MGQDPEQLFKQIEQWPERFGTRSWRKRAHRELDPVVHECFIAYANQKAFAEKNQAHGEEVEEDPDRVCPEWELFNRARANSYRRQKAFEMLLGAFDGAAGVAAFFGAYWIFMWLIEPSMYLALILGAHLAVIIVWALLRCLSWRHKSLEKLKLRFEYPPGNEDPGPLTHRSDKIPAIELEGRKYRSSTLLSRAMADRQERLRKEDLGQQVLSEQTERGFNRILQVLSGVFFLGFIGIFEQEQGFMPLWLSIVLISLGLVGLFFTARLRDRLLAPKSRYYNSDLRWFDSSGRSQST